MKRLIKTALLGIMLFIGICCSNVLAFPASSSTQYNGIDVSEWQGNINWSEVSNSGVSVVYIRASEGAEYVDPYALTNYTRAKENGIKVGFYHYLTAVNQEEALNQAEFFVSTIKGLEIDCKLAMDFETFDGLSIEKINIIARTFLEEVERLSGKDVVIYSDAYNARFTFSSELAADYPIWVADYYVSEPANGNWDTWEGFQYTDEGRITGIRDYVDRDYFTNNILLSDNTPISNTTTPDRETKTITIIVQRGNTLSQIAMQYNTSYEYLAKINNISNPNLIFVNQRLIVPIINKSINDTSHVLYIVQRGNTLTQIARQYGVSIEDIVRLNNIRNPNLIYVGEILRINIINNL